MGQVLTDWLLGQRPFDLDLTLSNSWLSAAVYWRISIILMLVIDGASPSKAFGAAGSERMKAHGCRDLVDAGALDERQ